MLKYGKNIKFNPEKLDLLNIDRQSVAFVHQKSSVLDIGCATGFIGKYFKDQKKCRVVGVELGEDEARIAGKVLNKVILGDIEDKKTYLKINEQFDVIFASAVIEHLKNPEVALINWKKLLKKRGKLIITTSNINHWSARSKFLLGNFDYQEFGIFDNTHLKFYNTKTFKKLVSSAGYNITFFSIDPVSGGAPKISKFFSKFFPNLFAYQMLIVASPK